MKVGKLRGQAEVVTFEKPTLVLFIREKICLAKANIQAKREGKNPMPDESLLSYLSTTRGGCKGKSYTQERVFAFDYDAICENYDIDLRTFTEHVRADRPSGSNLSNVSNISNTDNTDNKDE